METLCPLPAALSTVQNPGCPENLGQIQKLIFQRVSSNFVFDSTASKAFTSLASWTPLLVATDNTKIVVTPVFRAGKITPGKVITFGGGTNATVNGRKENTGFNSTDFTGEFWKCPAEVIAQLKQLEYGEQLMWYGINQFGQLIGNDIYPGHKGTEITGIPLYSQFFEDSGNEGFAIDDTAQFGFTMDYGWRDGIFLAKPTWNPLTSIVPVQET